MSELIRFVRTGVRTVNRESTRVWVCYSEFHSNPYYWSSDKKDVKLFNYEHDARNLTINPQHFNVPDILTDKVIKVKYTPATEAKIEFPKGY